MALIKGYDYEILIGDDDDIYHLYMDSTVYGDKTKLTKLFEKIIVKCWTYTLDYLTLMLSSSGIPLIFFWVKLYQHK